MKVIITENQHRLLRRVSEIEHIIEPVMDLTYEYLQGDDPTPLDMGDYDTFIDLITLKIANTIVNRSPFQEDEKKQLKKQIIGFILTNYTSTIRDYFSSRLNKGRNINESTHELKFKRRYEEIEDGIQDFILTHKLNAMDTFDSFLIEISYYVTIHIVHKMNIPEEDYVTYRNQLIRFIKNNFYTELKEFWDRNHYWGDNKNINEAYNKRMLQRRYQHFSEFIDSALSRYDVCIYTDVIDFVDRVMDYTADNLYESLFILGRDDNHSEYYQDIYDFISEHFVDRIHEFYEDNKHFCIDEDGNWIH